MNKTKKRTFIECPNCRKRISLDQVISCNDEFKDRDYYEGRCSDCAEQCEICNEWYEYPDMIKCEDCKKSVCPSDSDVWMFGDNRLRCNPCYKKYVKEVATCETCGNERKIIYDDKGWEEELICEKCYGSEQKELFMRPTPKGEVAYISERIRG